MITNPRTHPVWLSVYCDIRHLTFFRLPILFLVSNSVQCFSAWDRFINNALMWCCLRCDRQTAWGNVSRLSLQNTTHHNTPHLCHKALRCLKDNCTKQAEANERKSCWKLFCALSSLRNTLLFSPSSRIRWPACLLFYCDSRRRSFSVEETIRFCFLSRREEGLDGGKKKQTEELFIYHTKKLRKFFFL